LGDLNHESMDWFKGKSKTETMFKKHVFTINYIGVSCKFSHPILWMKYVQKIWEKPRRFGWRKDHLTRTWCYRKSVMMCNH
jgi:hypothetical protein